MASPSFWLSHPQSRGEEEREKDWSSPQSFSLGSPLFVIYSCLRNVFSHPPGIIFKTDVNYVGNVQRLCHYWVYPSASLRRTEVSWPGFPGQWVPPRGLHLSMQTCDLSLTPGGQSIIKLPMDFIIHEWKDFLLWTILRFFHVCDLFKTYSTVSRPNPHGSVLESVGQVLHSL